MKKKLKHTQNTIYKRQINLLKLKKKKYFLLYTTKKLKFVYNVLLSVSDWMYL